MYKALYRQYRPRTFSDLVGQTVIVQTLQNALKEDKVGHAYLFAGPRGTGKTSVAKIFAREIEGMPPDQDEEKAADIVEIDAASNNGVDEIRNLRDSANYAPIEYPFKIYIIDEVHMLSNGAFNALLKTIEEPPAQIKFILATTEPQKIPATILSRVQRFDFRRIDPKEIAARLEFVLKDQKINFDPQALKVIANASAGGLRDALSILDQAVAVSKDGSITLDDAYEITGSSRIDQQTDFVASLLKTDMRQAFSIISDILSSGKDPLKFAQDLLVLFKNLILIKSSPELVNSQSIDRIKKLSEGHSNRVFEKLIDLTADSLAKMKQSVRPDLYLEILAVKGSELVTEPDLKTSSVNILGQTSNEDRQQPLPEQKNNSIVHTPSSDNDAQISQTKKAELSDRTAQKKEPAGSLPADNQDDLQEKTADQTDVKVYTDLNQAWSLMQEAVKSELQSAKEAWPDIAADFQDSLSALAESAEPVAASREGLIIAFSHAELATAAAKTPDFISKLSENLYDLLGVRYFLVLIGENHWFELKKAFIQKIRQGKDFKEPDFLANKGSNSEPVIIKKSAPAPVKEKTDRPLKREKDENDVVKKAKDLFGDIVKIKGEDY